MVSGYPGLGIRVRMERIISTTDYSCGSQSVVSRLAMSSSLGDLFLQILGLHLRPTVSEILSMGPSSLMFYQALQVILVAA